MTDLGDWTAALERRFEAIGRTRLQGLGLLHPRLRVQALGWQAQDDGSAWGVLITPWFLNLVRRPGPQEAALAVGRTARRTLGMDHELEFLGAEDEVIGRYEAVSLFSPMHAFADQAAAVTTAWEVLGLLRRASEAEPDRGTPWADAGAAARARAAAPGPAPAMPAMPTTATTTTAAPSRRGLLFGRGDAGRPGPRP